jgi:hypothetical protein
MSMRAAINAMCKACIYDPHCGGGTWRQQVEACTSPRCPLYPFRPTARKPTADGGASRNGAKSTSPPTV